MSAKLINITLDLETLSTREDAAIIQIGCCIPEFDRKFVPAVAGYEFETTIRYEEALSSEFHKSNDTMEWWGIQDPETRKIVFSGQSNYLDALTDFVYWISLVKSGGADVAIFGNGSDFDNRLLTYTLDSFGMHRVWSFRNNRDLRTMKALFPVEIPELGPIFEHKHTALGDARFEARQLHTMKLIYGLEQL
jgi:exodeoxyribonuclease VIII